MSSAVDVGFTHVAFEVQDLQKSIDFYQRYAGMQVVHQREPGCRRPKKWPGFLT